MPGAGVVALNHEGRCVAACSEPIQGTMEPELAEALALRRAVYLAKDEHFSNVLFASDCQSLVNRIISGKIDRSSVGTVINDIKFASRGFVSAEFKHVRRLVNVAAHLLTKSCKNLSNLVIFHSTPDCIRETLVSLVM
ncbi:unnamed protein product [Triticum aestivum]|uniref:RNase H type-1 domain-containing protein n=1 Tax=Triticum aestivum TaxID=4565 RepID=A0A7H4LEI0_WHEAT|nr:unnamed protein product [Triticum aestivum]